MEKENLKRRTLCKWSFFLPILILGSIAWSQGSQAQEFPKRPITMLIGNSPGAGTDVCARIIAEGATKILGQELIPVNKPGGGGAVAMGILANSKGDGYTVLATVSNTLTSTPHMEPVPYDSLKDIIPIIQFGSLSNVIVVRSDSPFKSLKELIDFARKNPGKISYGMPGIATSLHLAMENLVLDEKVKIAIIPFDGSTPAVTALLGGHVSSCGSSTSGVVAHLKAGRLRPLAVIAKKRLEILPDTPTIDELGYPYHVYTGTYLFAAPKGISPAVLNTLEGTFHKAMETQKYRSVAGSFLMDVENPLSGKELKDLIERQYAKIGEIIQKANLKKK